MMAMAISALTFTACEDVPEPYPTPTPTNNGGNNGQGEGTATGDGTLENPFNSVAAAKAAKELGSGNVSEQMYYIKGKVVSIATDRNGNVLNFDQGTYGNASFYISDDGTETGQFYCYRVLYLGNKKWTQGAGDILKVGDEVIVCAKLTLYNTTPETQQNEGFLYSLNGKSEGGGTEGVATGDGSLENPFNSVAATNEAKKLASGAVSNKAYYIKGKVVSIATDKNGNVLNFDQGTYGNASFYISDDGTETGQFYCYRVLYLGNKKWAQGAGDILKVGDEVIVCAKLTMYNTTPETQQNEGYLYSLNGKTEGGGGGDTPAADAKAVTVAEFNAAAESNDVWYQLTGTVKNLKDGDKYGNFDLEDATGSVYVYGLLSEKGGAKQQFQDLVAAKGITNGCTLTIIGTRGSYNDKIEVTNAYFVSIEGGDTPGGGGGGDTPGGQGGEVSGASISIAAADFGFEDKGAATQKTLSDGTKIVFDKGEGSTAPAYYGGSYASVRIYAKNTVTITASKKIVKIEIETTDPSGSTKYNGNDMAYADGGSKVSIKKESDTKVSFSNLSASTVKIVNDHSEAKGGTQLRIKTLTITYAE